MTLFKKIAVVTGSRAEYGLLKNLLLFLNNDNKINLRLIVTGSHLSNFHGQTFNEIKKEKFKSVSKLNINLLNDSNSNIISNMSILLKKFSYELKKYNPDLVIVLGDRYELLPVAINCLINRYNLAHIHGGEITNGAYDDEIRHCISKIANLHFVTHKNYKKRLIQMGEDKKNIFVVGGLGVDSIRKTKIISKSILEKELNLKFKKKNLLVTFHPVTKEQKEIKNQIKNLLDALSELDDTLIIFTGVNADTNYHFIDEQIKKFTKKDKKYKFFKSLGQVKYYSLLKIVDAVIGNSSSGILEAPTFKTPTVNIGTRQEGRICANSIIHSSYEKKSILNSINKVYSKTFLKNLKKTVSPYGFGGAGKKIYKILKNIKKLENNKKFIDLKFL